MNGLRLRALELAVGSPGAEPVLDRAKAFLEFLEASDSPSQPSDTQKKYPESISDQQPGSRLAA